MPPKSKTNIERDPFTAAVGNQRGRRARTTDAPPTHVPIHAAPNEVVSEGSMPVTERAIAAVASLSVGDYSSARAMLAGPTTVMMRSALLLAAGESYLTAHLETLRAWLQTLQLRDEYADQLREDRNGVLHLLPLTGPGGGMAVHPTQTRTAVCHYGLDGATRPCRGRWREEQDLRCPYCIADAGPALASYSDCVEPASYPVLAPEDYLVVLQGMCCGWATLDDEDLVDPSLLAKRQAVALAEALASFLAPIMCAKGEAWYLRTLGAEGLAKVRGRALEADPARVTGGDDQGLPTIPELRAALGNLFCRQDAGDDLSLRLTELLCDEVGAEAP